MISLLKKYRIDWLPMFLLVLSAGSIFFVFFRKELLYLTLFVFGSLFLVKYFSKNNLTTLTLLSFFFFRF